METTINTEQDLILKLELLNKQIGNTPLFELRNIFQKPGIKLFAKLEWQQFGGSVKARPAFNIIKEAILTGKLDYSKTLIDASSGNTAIAYASIAASLGLKVKLFIPENASIERKQILKNLGAQLEFTSPFESTDGAQIAAKACFEAKPEQYFYADQYKNVNNWKAHYYSTANEIISQTNQEITHFVAGLGTTGTFTGTTKKLKEFNQEIETVELHPETIIHGLEGWKHLPTAIVPAFYDSELADRKLLINSQHAYDIIKKVAEKEGLLISPSSAANLVGAINVAEEINEGTIVTMFPDNAEKYSEVLKSVFNN